MSETGRKMNVEDVLSSIRRLVSEEARTASDAETTDKNASNTDAQLLQQSNAAEQDKLVLTPSLRISETNSPAPAASEIEQRIADIESLVMSEAVDHSQSDIAQNVDVQDIEDVSIDTPKETADFAEMVDEVTETVTEDATAEMMSALHLSMKDFARAEPPLTANLSGAPSLETPLDDDQNDTAEGTANDAIEVAEFSDIETSETLDDVSFPSDSPFEADLESVPPQPDFMQMVPDADDDVEIETDAAQAPVRDTIINREPPLSAPEPEPAAAASSALFEEPMDYTDDDTFLDEETLREMVSEMVRSELQGELGDRITRNVRKLVRREIHRAMASRDFE